MAVNIALDKSTSISPFIGEVVRIEGLVKEQPVIMEGVLSGITHTHSNVMVYMEFGQTTTFTPQGLRLLMD